MNRQRILFLLLAAVLFWGCTGQPQAGVPADAPAEISGSREDAKYVALTFDDGPRADTTSHLLDGLLQEGGVHATFFLVGKQIPCNADLVRRMKVEGHQVGNHTWDHVKLQGVRGSVVQEEIGKTDTELHTLLGNGTYWVRPPYGLINKNQQQQIHVPLVHWSVDPEDWKLRNADADVSAVLSKVQPGDIILMHDSVSASVDAALRIVDTLKAEGYQFVTVQELLALNSVTPQDGVLYYSARKSR